MPITVDEVRHVAALARLEVPEADLLRHAEELGRILEHVARLSALDTSDLPPTSSALAVAGVARTDTCRPGLGEEAALVNAPARHAGLFLVPRVVDGG